MSRHRTRPSSISGRVQPSSLSSASLTSKNVPSARQQPIAKVLVSVVRQRKCSFISCPPFHLVLPTVRENDDLRWALWMRRSDLKSNDVTTAEGNPSPTPCRLAPALEIHAASEGPGRCSDDRGEPAHKCRSRRSDGRPHV